MRRWPVRMSLKWRQDAEPHKPPTEQHNVGAVGLGLINVHTSAKSREAYEAAQRCSSLSVCLWRD